MPVARAPVTPQYAIMLHGSTDCDVGTSALNTALHVQLYAMYSPILSTFTGSQCGLCPPGKADRP